MFHIVKGDSDGIGKGNEIKEAMFSLSAWKKKKYSVSI